jgi:hypothetical protein
MSDFKMKLFVSIPDILQVDDFYKRKEIRPLHSELPHRLESLLLNRLFFLRTQDFSFVVPIWRTAPDLSITIQTKTKLKSIALVRERTTADCLRS